VRTIRRKKPNQWRQAKQSATQRNSATIAGASTHLPSPVYAPVTQKILSLQSSPSLAAASADRNKPAAMAVTRRGRGFFALLLRSVLCVKNGIRKYEIKYENTKLNPKLKIISYFRIFCKQPFPTRLPAETMVVPRASL